MQDKTYTWLMIVAFVGFAIATGFAILEWNEYKQPQNVKKSIFE